MSIVAAVKPPRRRPLWPLVTALAGWLELAVSYYVVLPVLGVLSTVTWALIWLGWLGAILGPAFGVMQSIRSRRVVPAAVWGMCAVLAMAVLSMVGAPARTVDDLYQSHRDGLDQLAADYRAGRINDDRALPWRLRLLAVDGRAHPRCSSKEKQHGCGVFLLLWQNWRAEAGVGIAYFPVRPDSDVAIATASGASGVPVRELGRDWWLVG